MTDSSNMKTTSSDAIKTLKVLKKIYTKRGDMDLGSPENTLLGTLMSAQTTDVQVLRVFPGFRKKFPSWSSLARADVRSIERTISTIGLYRAKAKSLKGLAQMILADFDGKVPQTIEELIRLPGVGRKTASVVLSCAFNQPAVAVDTHVFRVTRRLGWTTKMTPEKVERDVQELIPKPLWSDVNRTMVQFGRDVCKGGTPQCWRCPVAEWCSYSPKTSGPASSKAKVSRK